MTVRLTPAGSRARCRRGRRGPSDRVRVGLAFLTLREDGAVLLRRRPEAGLLGGMLEVPSTDWAEALPPLDEAMRGAPVRAEWWGVPGVVSHTFTHFKLESLVYRALVPASTRRSPSGPIRSAASGSPAATSTAWRCRA